MRLRDSPGRHITRWLLRFTAACLVIVVTIALFPSTAVAQTEIDVAIGFDGLHRSGGDLLVQIEIDADRLIDGELRISAQNDAATTVVVPVEVAGGATKRFVAVIPAVTQWQGRVTVRLLEGGDQLATGSANLDSDNGAELVGVLPSLTSDMPASESLAVPLGTARFFPVTDALLSAGPGAIDALGTVIASSNDITQLSNPAYAALDTWLRQGGTLIIDEVPGPVPRFDVVASETGAPLGAGTVVASSGSFGQGQWSGVLLPTAFRQDRNGGGGIVSELTGENMWFGGPLANSLANDAGFGLPSLRVVLPVMAAYVLLVGPFSWFFLRRRRRSNLLWVVLPALALIFTAAVWITGTALRSGTNDAHGTIIEIDNGSALAHSTVLRSSRNGGTTGITLSNPWQAIQTTDDRFGPSGTTTGSTIERSIDSTRVEAELDAGEFVLLGGEGPAPQFNTALVATASSVESGKVTGSITNQFDVALVEVAVFTGSQGIQLGRIEPGETVSYELDGPDRNPRNQPIEMVVWRNATNNNFGPFGPSQAQDTAINLDLWSSYLGANIGRVRQQGVVTIAGWTTELASPLNDAIVDGRTLVVLRTEITSGPEILTDVGSRRVLLRGPEQGGFEPEFGQGFQVRSAWRLDAAEGIDPGTLALQIPRSVTKIEVWNGTAWVVVDEPEPGAYQLPIEAFVQGSVFVIPSLDFERDPSLGRDFTLQTIDPNRDLLGDLLTAEPAP